MRDFFLSLRDAGPYPMIGFSIIFTILAIALLAQASGS